LVSGAASRGLAPAKQTLAQLDQLMPAADRKRALAMTLDRPKPVAPASASGSAAPSKTEELASAKSPKTTKKKAAAPIAAPDSAANADRIASAEAPPSPLKEVQKPTEKPAREAEAEKKQPEPKAAAPATGAWRIQLGAFAQKANAEAMYKKLSSKDALDGRKPFYIPAGAVTRLQVGPFETKGAAASACRAVGVACFPVPAK
jgi:cell division septation protein DedD